MHIIYKHIKIYKYRNIIYITSYILVPNSQFIPYSLHLSSLVAINLFLKAMSVLKKSFLMNQDETSAGVRVHFTPMESISP